MVVFTIVRHKVLIKQNLKEHYPTKATKFDVEWRLRCVASKMKPRRCRIEQNVRMLGMVALHQKTLFIVYKCHLQVSVQHINSEPKRLIDPKTRPVALRVSVP